MKSRSKGVGLAARDEMAALYSSYRCQLREKARTRSSFAEVEGR